MVGVLWTIYRNLSVSQDILGIPNMIMSAQVAVLLLTNHVLWKQKNIANSICRLSESHVEIIDHVTTKIEIIRLANIRH